jgi:hypothetical protein
MVEHGAHNPAGAGSTPAGPTNVHLAMEPGDAEDAEKERS